VIKPGVDVPTVGKPTGEAHWYPPRFAQGTFEVENRWIVDGQDHQLLLERSLIVILTYHSKRENS
jgi:hypothetical protein